MSVDIVMPRLSDSMEEGTILRWIKSAGEEVAVGDELVEIETDKANMVYESDAAGTLIELVAEEGATLPIGEVIARVGEKGEAPVGAGDSGAAPGATPPEAQSSSGLAPAPAPAVPQPAPAPAVPQPAGAPASAPTGDGARVSGDGRVKASPIARRIAAEKGLDLAGLQGSGPGGRIVKADVERAGVGASPQKAQSSLGVAPTPAIGAKPEEVETAKGQVSYEEPTKLQATVARRMAESKAVAPHFYLQASIDMSRCVEARGAIKAAAGADEVVPSFNDMVVKAAALALREFPRANGAYRDGRFELYSRVNVGVAVAAQDALVVPTVFDADVKGLRRIASETRALAARVREGQITPPERSGGTFTVSNLGMFGIENFAAVINTPQAGILAVGAITETPVVRDGEIATARLMAVTLACDHRILYGSDGAEFLARIRALLEEPVSLAL
ncbi:MAG: dihydrolipoamide acetyltransferase family protein [Solirubrobacterales bacterium]